MMDADFRCLGCGGLFGKALKSDVHWLSRI